MQLNRLVGIGAVCALLTAAARAGEQTETLICGFEPGAEEPFLVVGGSRPETAPEFVREGFASLRVTCSSTDSRPGVRLNGAAFRGEGARRLLIDVANPQKTGVVLHVRADDEGAAPHRREVSLPPGWTTVQLDLKSLTTDTGARLDSRRLVLVSLTTEVAEGSIDLVFDRVRFVEQEPEKGARDRRTEALSRFETLFPAERSAPARAGLIAGLHDADVPRRIEVLDRFVLGDDSAFRQFEAALSVLEGTRAPESVAAVVRAASQSTGFRRLRWIEAAARMNAPAACEFIARLASKGIGAERVLALAASARRADAGLLPALQPDLGGPWQLESARILCLRAHETGPAFEPLTGFLASPHARVRADALEALVARTGRDFGEQPAAWRAWRSAASTGAPRGEGRGAYATYYGIPLSPARPVFVVDVSGSMQSPLSGAAAAYAARKNLFPGIKEPSRLDLAKAELASAITALTPKAVFDVVCFSSGVFSWTDGPSVASKERKEKAVRFAERLGARGSTDLHGGLLAAIETSKSPERDFRDSYDSVYLLTDGEPTAGRVIDAEGIVADVRDRLRGRMVRIHTIGLGEANSALLGALSLATGGTSVDLSR